VRVSGGKWSGRKLKHPGKSPVRPTSGRVKEMLFNIIGDKIIDAYVVDLCCGTGSLGIEALSRGAAFVSFVDIAIDSLKSTAANLKLCDAEPESFKLHRSDSFRFIKSHCPDHNNLIVLADPPYNADVTSEIWMELVKCFDSGKAMFIAVEHESGIKLSSESKTGTVDVRKAGNSSIAILER